MTLQVATQIKATHFLRKFEMIIGSTNEMYLSRVKTNEARYLFSTEAAQDIEFRSSFGRIQDAIIYFRDL